MASKPFRLTCAFLFLGALTFLLLACSKDEQSPTSTAPASPTSTQSPLTPTPVPPTETPVPLAALVNGEGITLNEYQAELARAQAAVSTGSGTQEEVEKHVLDELIDGVLLAQAAREQGFSVDEAKLQERFDQLASQVGGLEALKEWMGKQSYDEGSFKQALARSIAAAWMRDKIIASLPDNVEQIHARQILLYNSNEADQVLGQIETGTDFATLAARYDPIALGDLGWFPRGYLIEPELDDVVFSLEVGEHSPVIKTRLGSHIIKVLERDAQRPLDPDARLVLQTKAIRQWLEERRAQSKIEILLSQ